MRTQSSFLSLLAKAASEVGVVSVPLKDNRKISERGGLVTQVVVGIGSTICLAWIQRESSAGTTLCRPPLGLYLSAASALAHSPQNGNKCKQSRVVSSLLLTNQSPLCRLPKEFPK